MDNCLWITGVAIEDRENNVVVLYGRCRASCWSICGTS